MEHALWEYRNAPGMRDIMPRIWYYHSAIRREPDVHNFIHDYATALTKRYYPSRESELPRILSQLYTQYQLPIVEAMEKYHAAEVERLPSTVLYRIEELIDKAVSRDTYIRDVVF